MARSGRTMIITQTPLRIGLLGGGPDLPDYYREHGGRVLNAAPDKYVYVIDKQRFDDDIYANYSKNGDVSRVQGLGDELVREALQATGGGTGVENTILAEQNANIEATRPQLDLLRDLAGFAVERLRSGDMDAIGPALRESWEAKRKLASGVSNDQIDRAVTRALDAGASGAKLTGAGGGGFLLVICPMERQRAVRASLADMRELPVKLDRLGSRVVLNVLRDIWGC